MAQDHSHHGQEAAARSGFFTSRIFLAFLGFAAIAIVLLWEEHRAHILGVLPYLFLLACPLLHMFGHGGHGGHGGSGQNGQQDRRPVSTDGGAP